MMGTNEEVKAALKAEGVTDADFAQMRLVGGPKPGSRWRHYKGKAVKVLVKSVRESDIVPLVTYVDEANGYVWTRTREDFEATVDTPDGSVRRFAPIEGDS